MAMTPVKTLAVASLLLWAQSTEIGAQGNSDQNIPQVAQEVRRSKTPPLRQITPRFRPVSQPRVVGNYTKSLPFQPNRRGPTGGPDPIRQTGIETESSILTTPAPWLSFEGVSDEDNETYAGLRVVPPDTQGDVGLNHYIQMNNISFEIFDKSGNSVLGPLPNNIFWQNLGGVCGELNQGDPIVLYDEQADRWLFSQLALGSSSSLFGEASGHQCFAISQTNDPTGAYWVYDFIVSPCPDMDPVTGWCIATWGINDYPKISIWPDGYYLTANQFHCDVLTGVCPYDGVRVAVFERDRMLDGQTTRMVAFDPLPDNFSMQPAHLEGFGQPSAGTPNPILQIHDAETFGTPGPDGYDLWEASVDWTNVANSSLSRVGIIQTDPFDSDLCGYGNCVPQPQVGERLDTLSQFTMYRATYRKFTSHQSIVLNHSVDVDGSDTAGIRWAELRNDGSGWGLHQTGTFAPADGLHRWMGSVTMDGAGNIALSYSVSSATQFPSIAYTSRSAEDPAGVMTGGEAVCHFGTGSQSNASVNTAGVGRWGDYSTISVDPSDDCTFWLTNEYYRDTGAFDFRTRICTFALDSCSGGGGCIDGDGDGFPASSCGGTDCDDTSASVFPGAAELCSDGLDNDCDGLVDSADDECAVICVPTANKEKGPRCSDGLDNDCDGFFDGEDPDCGGGGEEPEPSCSKEDIKPRCSDGVDNDCDGLIDGDDPDCARWQ